MRDGHGHESVIHTTQHHPFWDEHRHLWVKAGELAAGDKLTTDGGSSTVVGVRTFAGAADMHNLTVGDTHTFYVAAGDVAVLVHNCFDPDDHEAVTERLQDHVDRTVNDFEEGRIELLEGQKEQLAEAAKESARRSTQNMPRRAEIVSTPWQKTGMRQDPDLQHLYVNRQGEKARISTTSTGNWWWDITSDRWMEQHTVTYPQRVWGWGTLLSTRWRFW